VVIRGLQSALLRPRGGGFNIVGKNDTEGGLAKTRKSGKTPIVAPQNKTADSASDPAGR